MLVSTAVLFVALTQQRSCRRVESLSASSTPYNDVVVLDAESEVERLLDWPEQGVPNPRVAALVIVADLSNRSRTTKCALDRSFG
jgi:hypothetical protein